MRNPPFMAMRGYIKDGRYFVAVRLRYWHPSFWAYLWRTMDVRPTVFKPFVVAWAVWRMWRAR